MRSPHGVYLMLLQLLSGGSLVSASDPIYGEPNPREYEHAHTHTHTHTHAGTGELQEALCMFHENLAKESKRVVPCHLSRKDLFLVMD